MKHNGTKAIFTATFTMCNIKETNVQNRENLKAWLVGLL